MPLIAATNISHNYGDDIILDSVSISIEAGERIGMVGRNGTGKSTLLKVLGGLLTPDSGSVSVQRGCRVGYLTQDPVLDPGETLRDAAEGAFAELHRLHQVQHHLYEEMAAASDRGEPDAVDRLMKRQSELERQIEAAGGYAIDHQIDAVLHGLGFNDGQFSILTSDLSGGQRGRLALARLLLEQPEVLLLDEPTNHLDIDGCLWLERFLKEEFRGAVLMVSHDRYLLDNIVNRIVETEGGRLIDYPGNYEAFRELRAERRLSMHRTWEKQQTRFKKEEAFIRRYKAGQRAKQARGRETKLDREKSGSTVERPMEMEVFNFELPRAERTGDVVIAARGISKQYEQEDGSLKVLFRELDVTIGRGERWGIIGPNGAGKSTLVRCLLRQLEPDTGTVKLGTNVKVGYYSQTHEHVEADVQVYRYLQGVILKESPAQALSEQQARNLAGAFLFSGDEQLKEMGMLSGGERSRAVLAGLLASAKNLLVLDEPTNHLDIPSAERLEEALSGRSALRADSGAGSSALRADSGAGSSARRADNAFDGSLILISHDRALIDGTCDHLLVLDGEGNVETFIGNYTEWHRRDQLRQREREGREADVRRRREDQERARRAAEEARKQQKAADPRSRNSLNGLARMKTEQLEARIEKIETRIREIDAAFADPDIFSNQARCTKLGNERRRLVEELEPLEFEWSQRG